MNKLKASKEKEPKFLPDTPLTADKEKEADFGHESIASNLAKMVRLSPAPFTIGLFGKWGTGKSTIINLLIERIKGKGIEVAIIDAWKYEEDSLRRQMLITLDDELKLGLDYKNKLNQSLTESNPSKKITFNLELLLKIVGWYGIVPMAILILGLALQAIPEEAIPFLHKMKSMLANLFVSGGLLVFLLQFILGLFEKIGITVTEHRTDSAEGFERRFKEDVLGHGKIQGKRLLIIIDNLDRCSYQKAVEMLSTIKTFLAKDEAIHADCIFLITCDDEAIKQHIKSTYLKDNNGSVNAFDVDEFLRKFFNAFIRIPTFIDTELQNYTEKLLKETNVLQFESNNNLAYVITTSFRENPRQIKQFINTLLAHFLLAKEREGGSKPLIPSGTVTSNAAFLAKLLIIRQRFPEIYKELEDRYLTIDELETMVFEGETVKEFKDFLRATKIIRAPDISPFIHLKQSHEEIAIPGSKEFELGLIDNRLESVSEKLGNIKSNPDQLMSLKRFLLDRIDRNKGRKQLLLNIVSCSLEGLKQNNMELEKDFYNGVGDVLAEQSALKNELQALEPSLIFGQVLSRCDVQFKNPIIGHFVTLFTLKEQLQRPTVVYASKVLEQFILYKDWIKDYLPQIKKALVELYSTEPQVLILLKDKTEEQKNFLTDEVPHKLAGSLSDQDLESKQSLNEKIEICISMVNIAHLSTANVLISRAVQLINNENQKAMRDIKENLFLRLTEALLAYEQLIVQAPDKAELNKLSDVAIQSFAKLGDWSQRKIVIPLFLILARVDQARRPNLETQIQNFFNNTDIGSMKDILTSFDAQNQQALIQKYETSFRQRVQQDQAIFDLLYEKVPAVIRTQWFNNLIRSPHYGRALNKLEELKFKVDDPKAIIEKLLEQAQAVDETQKRKFYTVVNQMECADNTDLRNTFSSNIKTSLRTNNASIQETGLIALREAKYLPDSTKREIARDTIEWLRTLNPNNASHVHSIKSVLINWTILEDPLKKDYVDFVFDKLIKRTVSVENISLGNEMLSEIKPTYEEYQIYFDDVYTKIQNESEPNIKKELTGGLSKLKPKESGEKGKAFWEKVEKLLETTSTSN